MDRELAVWDDEIPVGMVENSELIHLKAQLEASQYYRRRNYDMIYVAGVVMGIIGLALGYGLSYV